MDRIEELDNIIVDLYNRYTGLEIAESIRRYRQANDIRIERELELKLLRKLKKKHEGTTLTDVDTDV